MKFTTVLLLKMQTLFWEPLLVRAATIAYVLLNLQDLPLPWFTCAEPCALLCELVASTLMHSVFINFSGLFFAYFFSFAWALTVSLMRCVRRFLFEVWLSWVKMSAWIESLLFSFLPGISFFFSTIFQLSCLNLIFYLNPVALNNSFKTITWSF